MFSYLCQSQNNGLEFSGAPPFLNRRPPSLYITVKALLYFLPNVSQQDHFFWEGKAVLALLVNGSSSMSVLGKVLFISLQFFSNLIFRGKNNKITGTLNCQAIVLLSY